MQSIEFDPFAKPQLPPPQQHKLNLIDSFITTSHHTVRFNTSQPNPLVGTQSCITLQQDPFYFTTYYTINNILNASTLLQSISVRDELGIIYCPLSTFASKLKYFVTMQSKYKYFKMQMLFHHSMFYSLDYWKYKLLYQLQFQYKKIQIDLFPNYKIFDFIPLQTKTVNPLLSIQYQMNDNFKLNTLLQKDSFHLKLQYKNQMWLQYFANNNKLEYTYLIPHKWFTLGFTLDNHNGFVYDLIFQIYNHSIAIPIRITHSYKEWLLCLLGVTSTLGMSWLWSKKQKLQVNELNDETREKTKAEEEFKQMISIIEQKYQTEKSKNGLVILEAKVHHMDISKQLQFYVQDSQLNIPPQIPLSKLMGVYLPRLHFEQISIHYLLSGKDHHIVFKQGDGIQINC